ncbi:MAG: hypothetical protein ACD_73C00747G0002 [uncultured bacterium]|nr:MAG: hypothetical protein ACD_73C00747G0002 [uncultured bacterium]
MASGSSKYGLISKLNLEDLYNSFLGLEEKQQLMTIGGIVVIFIIIILMPISCAYSKLSKLESDYEKGSKNRESFSQKISEHQNLQAQLDLIKKGMAGSKSGSLNSIIESLANEAEIGSNIDRLKPMSLGSTDYYEEDGVDAVISNVNLDQISKFLLKIEQNKSVPLHIKKLDIKTRYNKRDQLTATMQIGTFKLKGEESE